MGKCKKIKLDHFEEEQITISIIFPLRICSVESFLK